MTDIMSGATRMQMPTPNSPAPRSIQLQLPPHNPNSIPGHIARVSSGHWVHASPGQQMQAYPGAHQQHHYHVQQHPVHYGVAPHPAAAAVAPTTTTTTTTTVVRCMTPTPRLRSGSLPQMMPPVQFSSGSSLSAQPPANAAAAGPGGSQENPAGTDNGQSGAPGALYETATQARRNTTPRAVPVPLEPVAGSSAKVTPTNSNASSTSMLPSGDQSGGQSGQMTTTTGQEREQEQQQQQQQQQQQSKQLPALHIPPPPPKLPTQSEQQASYDRYQQQQQQQGSSSRRPSQGFESTPTLQEKSTKQEQEEAIQQDSSARHRHSLDSSGRSSSLTNIPDRLGLLGARPSRPSATLDPLSEIQSPRLTGSPAQSTKETFRGSSFNNQEQKHRAVDDFMQMLAQQSSNSNTNFSDDASSIRYIEPSDPMKSLQQALQKEDLDDLSQAILRALESGRVPLEVLERARAAKVDLEDEKWMQRLRRQASHALQQAMHDDSPCFAAAIENLNFAISRAKEANVHEDLLATAREQLERLSMQQDAEEALLRALQGSVRQHIDFAEILARASELQICPSLIAHARQRQQHLLEQAQRKTEQNKTEKEIETVIATGTVSDLKTAVARGLESSVPRDLLDKAWRKRASLEAQAWQGEKRRFFPGCSSIMGSPAPVGTPAGTASEQAPADSPVRKSEAAHLVNLQEDDEAHLSVSSSSQRAFVPPVSEVLKPEMTTTPKKQDSIKEEEDEEDEGAEEQEQQASAETLAKVEKKNPTREEKEEKQEVSSLERSPTDSQEASTLLYNMPAMPREDLFNESSVTPRVPAEDSQHTSSILEDGLKISNLSERRLSETPSSCSACPLRAVSSSFGSLGIGGGSASGLGNSPSSSLLKGEGFLGAGGRGVGGVGVGAGGPGGVEAGASASGSASNLGYSPSSVPLSYTASATANVAGNSASVTAAEGEREGRRSSVGRLQMEGVGGDLTNSCRTAPSPRLELPTYGLDSELKAKAAAKADPSVIAEAAQWVQTITGAQVVGNFYEALRTGQVLCLLVNQIRPNTIAKINTPGSPFKERENITNFLRACRRLGVQEYALFSTDDLYDGINTYSVAKCLHALGGAIQRTVPEFKGPHLGVADTSNAKRDSKRELRMASQTGGFHGSMERAHMDLTSGQIVRGGA